MATTVLDLENLKQASYAIEEERADPPFQGIKNELEGVIALFQEIVSKWDSSKASKKNDEANLPSHQSSKPSKKNDETNPLPQQSSEATKKNDEANPRALCCKWIKKKKRKPLFEANPPSRQSSDASKKNDEANTLSHQSSEANRKNGEAGSRWSKKKEALFEVIVSKWDSSLALRSRWIKKKLENLKALYEVRVWKWEDILLDQVSALEREVGNLVSGPYDNDVDKLNRIIGNIQLIRDLVTPGMVPDLESRIRMISEAISIKEEEAGHQEEKSSFQRIKKELENMIDLLDGGVDLLSQVSALVGDVDKLVSGPYDNDGDKLNRIIGDVQRMRNLVTPGSAVPDLEYRILMISEAIQKKEPGPPQEESSIKKKIKNLIALFEGKVSKWDECLQGQVSALDTLSKIVYALEHGVENNNRIERKLNRIIGDIERITKFITPLRPINIDLEREEYQPEEASANKVSIECQQLDEEKMKNLRASYDNLENKLKSCLLYLSIFPESSIIKKRPLIYWWIGEGLIEAEGFKTTEEVAEELFVKLIAEGMIIATSNNRCEVHPWIHHMLISLAKEDLFVFDSTGTHCPRACLDLNTSCPRACLSNDISCPCACLFNKNLKPNPRENFDRAAAKLVTVFNVNEGYPSFSDANWLKKLKYVKTLQLGRWQDSVKHHIEMEDNILKDLGAQKNLKYLSLRGISRITELPDSIINLISLEILDLRACHDLERLPNKIESLRKLTHLDVAECYFLERMPKGIENLSSLQVLKGFVVGYSYENACRFGDIHKLKKLRKLSIRIGKSVVAREEKFEKLNEIASLRCLTISWEGNLSLMEFHLLFPPGLEKLDLRGIPVKKAPGWLDSSKLKNLKKLCIRGGELGILGHENGGTGSWQVEILVLKYLENLNITILELWDKFPHLRYLEKIQCHENDEDVVWDKSKGQLWPKEEKQRHAARERGASSSKS